MTRPIENTLKYISQDLDKLEGFVAGLDSFPGQTARQRRAAGLIDAIRAQIKALKDETF